MYLKVKNCLFLFVTCAVFTALLTAAPWAEAATDFKMWGDFDISMSYLQNKSLSDDRTEDRFSPRQRVRMWMMAKTSDEIKAYAMFRIATGRWGQRTFPCGRDAGYALDTDGVNIRTRFLFVDWTPADSGWSVRLGIIPVNTPFATFHTGILDSSAGGIEVRYKFNDTVAAHLAWARPFDDYGKDSDAKGNSKGNNLDDEMDLFMFKLPLTFADPKMTITPWAFYSNIGKDSGYWQSGYVYKFNTMSENGRGFWGGLAARADLFDDFTFKFDVTYGSVLTSGKAKNYNSQGWQLATAVDYTLDWGIPGIFGWYGSGSDADKIKKDNKWGVLPAISAFDIGFNPTSFGFGDGYGVNMGAVISAHMGGRWGIGAQIKDVTFVDNLSHTLRFAYYRGTNDKDVAKLDPVTLFKSKIGAGDYILMTEKDDAFEINFNHELKIYENFNIYANLGYIHLDRGNCWKDDSGSQNAWQMAFNFRYKF